MRGGSSSPCLHWMHTGIEQNGRGLAAAQLCQRARGSGPVSLCSLSRPSPKFRVRALGCSGEFIFG
jgi:hypothetical protein